MKKLLAALGFSIMVACATPAQAADRRDGVRIQVHVGPPAHARVWDRRYRSQRYRGQRYRSYRTGYYGPIWRNYDGTFACRTRSGRRGIVLTRYGAPVYSLYQTRNRRNIRCI